MTTSLQQLQASQSFHLPLNLLLLLALTLEEPEQHCELESMNQGEQNKTYSFSLLLVFRIKGKTVDHKNSELDEIEIWLFM